MNLLGIGTCITRRIRKVQAVKIVNEVRLLSPPIFLRTIDKRMALKRTWLQIVITIWNYTYMIGGACSGWCMLNFSRYPTYDRHLIDPKGSLKQLHEKSWYLAGFLLKNLKLLLMYLSLLIIIFLIWMGMRNIWLIGFYYCSLNIIIRWLSCKV